MQMQTRDKNLVSMVVILAGAVLITSLQACGEQAGEPQMPQSEEDLRALAASKADLPFGLCDKMRQSNYTLYESAVAIGLCDAYDPCEGKGCGDECSICDLLDPDCFEIQSADVSAQSLKNCNAAGECVSTAVSCDDEPATTCEQAGGQCGALTAEGVICPAGFMLAGEAGTCPVGAGCCMPAYDPCEGKATGDACTICPPGATDCFETQSVDEIGIQVVKACDMYGRCLTSACDGLQPLELCDPCFGQWPCMHVAMAYVCTAELQCLPIGAPF